MHKQLLAFLALGIASLDTSAKAGFGTNGTVNAIVTHGDKIFLAGNFNQVGALVPYGANYDDATAKVNLRSARPDGIVRTVVPDGAGGWYIGGSFQNVGGTPHAMVAHILPNGSVSSWNPGFSGGTSTPGLGLGTGGAGVMTLAIHDGKLYAGGNFSAVGAAVRQYMASFDLATGALTSFAPNLNNSVRSMAFTRNMVYVGGEFTTVSGGTVNRKHLAAFDTATSTPTSWAPAADQSVFAVAFNGPRVIVGGAFGSFNNGAVDRGRVAMMDSVSGTLASWNPEVRGNQVFAVAVSGSRVYVGGYFHSVNSATYQRGGMAELDTSSNLPTAWAPPTTYSNEVHSIKFHNGKMYVAGYLSDMASTSNGMSGVRIYDSVTMTQDAWDPRIGGVAYSVAVQGTSIYAGGDYLITNTVDRMGLAAFYTHSGAVTPWNPRVNHVSQTLTASGDKIFAGGDFTAANGSVTRNRAAAFDTTTGTVTSWNPNFNSSVRKLIAYGPKIYAGGMFTTVNGSTARNYAAGFDTTSGIVNNWDPRPNAAISDMSATGTKIYIGGGFSTVNQFTNRATLAAVDTSFGMATSWNPYTDGYVGTVYADGGRIYVAGNFSRVQLGNVMRQNAASFDTLTGLASPWDPAFNQPPVAFARIGAHLYAGGSFAFVNGSTMRRALAQTDTATGLLTSWDANAAPNNTYARVASLLPAGGNGLYVGGEFVTLGSEPQSGFSALNIVTATPLGLKLEAFTATRQGSVNQLSWKGTAAATDIFQLEKSADGDVFSSFATLSGSEASGSYTDLTPFPGVTYYRLRIFSPSGRYSFSPVVAVRSADIAPGAVSLAPVPATSQIRITCTDAALNGSPAQVLDLQGRVVARFSLESGRGLDISGWPAGSYILKISNGTNLRFVKQ